MEIIPAIDIIQGQCVRLTEGDYDRVSIYDADPVAMAQRFEAAGIRRLHLVDLDGARMGRVVNMGTLEAIARATSLEIDFGGGIHQEEDLKQIFNLGATYATIGSMAVREEATVLHWMEMYGPEKFLLGADFKNGALAVSGWKETVALDIFAFIRRYQGSGIRQVFCTDVSKDGKLMGPSFDLYRRILEACPGLDLIASGGVSTIEDLIALESLGCAGAIVGKAIYEGRISLEELQQLNQVR